MSSPRPRTYRTYTNTDRKNVVDFYDQHDCKVTALKLIRANAGYETLTERKIHRWMNALGIKKSAGRPVCDQFEAEVLANAISVPSSCPSQPTPTGTRMPLWESAATECWITTTGMKIAPLAARNGCWTSALATWSSPTSGCLVCSDDLQRRHALQLRSHRHPPLMNPCKLKSVQTTSLMSLQSRPVVLMTLGWTSTGIFWCETKKSNEVDIYIVVLYLFYVNVSIAVWNNSIYI